MTHMVFQTISESACLNILTALMSFDTGHIHAEIFSPTRASLLVVTPINDKRRRIHIAPQTASSAYYHAALIAALFAIHTAPIFSRAYERISSSIDIFADIAAAAPHTYRCFLAADRANMRGRYRHTSRG